MSRRTATAGAQLTPGSIPSSAIADGAITLAKLAAALQLGIDPTQIQIITSGTTGTIAASDRLVVIATGSGAFSLTAAAISSGRSVAIWKSSTDANSITIVRTGSETIQGTAANFVLPGSTSALQLGWTLQDYSATQRLVF